MFVGLVFHCLLTSLASLLWFDTIKRILGFFNCELWRTFLEGSFRSGIKYPGDSLDDWPLSKAGRIPTAGFCPK